MSGETTALEKSNIAELDSRKAGLREYFGGHGFERWRTIYSDGPVSFIRRTVREGHAEVVRLAMDWIAEANKPEGNIKRVLDAGCGPGVVTLELARKSYEVVGCDLSAQMVEYAHTQIATLSAEIQPKISFVCSDLETIGQHTTGSFDLIVCLDVLIYYPEDELERIVAKLTALGPRRLIFTYAPGSLPLRLMHAVGRKFPRTQRATSLEIIGENKVRAALSNVGFKLARQRHFNKGFYHVVLAEAVLS